MIKNTAGQKVGAQLVAAADGSAFTGSVTAYVTGDAGTQAAGSVSSGACAHEGNGYHTYAPAQAETNYDLVAFTFVGTGAVPQSVQIYTRAATPDVNVATIAANAITATAINADAITAAKIAADAVNEIADQVWDEALSGHTTAGTAGKALSDAGAAGSPPSAASIADAVWDEALSGHLGAGSTGEALDAAGSGASPSTIAAAVWDEDITTHTTPDSAGEALGMVPDLETGSEIADRMLARNIAGGSDGGRTVTDAFRALRNRTEVAAGTLTVYQEDDTTPAWDGAVTTAAGDPITSVDPSS